MPHGIQELACSEPLASLVGLHRHRGKRREQKNTPLQSIHHALPIHLNLQGGTLLWRGGKINQQPPIQNPPSEFSLKPRKSRGEAHQYLSWRVNLTLDKANSPHRVWLLSVVEKILGRENVLYFKCICFVFQMHLNSPERPCKAGCLLNLSTRDCFSLQIKIRAELNPGIWVNLQFRQFGVLLLMSKSHPGKMGK